ncbi:MAG: PaaI family thioesterase [Paludibacteraceae bacterium]|nr:PaaI family thioesterase [Paludibacteraceae bacterium]MCR4619474.1 PaaI family thioesterase [Paludibacteraceae bacterium]
MYLDDISEELMCGKEGLSRTLKMTYLSTPEHDTCKATMKVYPGNTQPFGFLSGGATLALAENTAGIGSMALRRGCMAMGINVTCQHVKAVEMGDTVTAYAKLIHEGYKLHVWTVDIRNSKGDLISTVNVTNYITPVSKRDEIAAKAEN